MPTLSVLIAVRNGGACFEQSLRSIAAQTFTDWEMVIVDDASNDGSADLAGRWASRDPRVRVIANSVNKGQTACLNEGLAACRGTWVARQDADDLSHPGRFSEQLSFLGSNPHTALLGTRGILIDGLGKRTGLLDVPCRSDSIAWCAPFLNPFLHTAVMFRRDAVEAAGGYDESYKIAQDYELWTRIAAEHATANVERRLVSYRNTDASLSRAGRDLAFAEADRVSDREAVRFLGRPWTSGEKLSVSEFRRGMEPAKHGSFWRVIAALEKETGGPLPRELRAAWHLRLAGCGGVSVWTGLAGAFRAAPAFTARWLTERLLSF